MHRLPILILGIFLGVVGIQAGEEQQEHHPQPPQDPRFEFLKSLEGTWTGPPLNEGMPDGVFEFHVTAGGHAVEEREMIGTPMEMVTLYYMRGKDLVATHYCMLGNQPQLKASRRVVDQTLHRGGRSVRERLLDFFGGRREARPAKQVSRRPAVPGDRVARRVRGQLRHGDRSVSFNDALCSRGVAAVVSSSVLA